MTSSHWLAARSLLVILIPCCILATDPLARPSSSPGDAVSTLHQNPQKPPEGFVPVSELPPDERLPAAPLLIGAYVFVWAVVFLYLWSLWRRLTRVEHELHAVARRLGANTESP